MDSTNEFRAAMNAHGLTPPDVIERGTRYRFPSNGKPSDDAGWCVLFADGEGGVFGDWRTGLSETWQARRGGRMSSTEREAFHRRCEATRAEASEEEARRHAETRILAASRWAAARPAAEGHPYLARKRVGAHGIKQSDGRLLVPLFDASGTLHNLQTIASDGTKRYLAGGRVRGCYFLIGTPDQVLCVAEGFATGATIHEATGYPVAVAFDAGNLEPVARSLRNAFPNARLVVCADDDAQTPGNPGIAKATAAARATGAQLVMPDFGVDRPSGLSDFNDLAAIRGLEAVRAALERARDVGGVKVSPFATAAPEASEWPEPLPLAAADASIDYPLDALPGIVGDAVREVVSFVQCPVPLAACSALAALSLSAQGLADVRRAEGLEGPISLYVLAIAESGERKTTCDAFFLEAIRDWERQEAERMAPDAANHAASVAAWEARREGLLAKIKELSKQNKPSGREEAELHDLVRDKPVPPRIPRLCFSDATPEALAWKLASGWPSGGVLSSEAGIVFGGHGMKGDSVMRNLALLNVLWDGGSQRVDRKQSESFLLSGARLTMGLAVQPETIHAFMDDSRGLARGTGFAARFLIAWPQSTQGNRRFRDPPTSWPSLAAFRTRLAALLSSGMTISEAGGIEPCRLEMTAEAKEAWIRFHDEVEAELRPGGDMESARDAASKAADNAARLAALFHILQNGTEGRIDPSHVIAGGRIAAWHLYEARRFFGSVAVPKAVALAAKLEEWLLRRCAETGLCFVSTRDVQQRGPGSLRDPKALNEALDHLTVTWRAKLVEEGRQRRIVLNPSLTKGGKDDT